MLLHLFIFPLFAYLAGSISFGYLIGKFKMKDDIRRYGSKSIGASNVSRIIGVSWGLMTVTLDILKAVGFLMITEKVILKGDPFLDTLTLCLCAFFIILGHIYPVFLKFKGGKGVSTFIGVMFYLFPIETLTFLGLYAVLLSLTRYNSLTSILLVAFFPFIILFYKGTNPLLFPYFGLCILLAFIIIIRHKENIKRLKKGIEPRFSFKKKVS